METTANITGRGERPKAFSLRVEESWILLLPLLVNIELETIGRVLRQEKEIKGIQTGKEVKLSLPADDMIFDRENPKGQSGHVGRDRGYELMRQQGLTLTEPALLTLH